MIGEVTRLSRWSTPDGKIVLCGDACHAMVPWLGAATDQGLEDAVVLAEILTHASSQEDLGILCGLYYELRHTRVEKVQDLAYSLGRAFSMADGAGQEERDLYLKMGARKRREIDPKYVDPFGDPSTHLWLDEFDILEEVSFTGKDLAGDGR